MHVRPSWKSSLMDALPYSCRALQSAFRLIPGAREVYIEVPNEPPSVNHIYRQLRNKKTNKPVFKLEDSVLAYREMVRIACMGKTFHPRGVTAAIVVIESPRWITKEYKVGRKDVDNTLKSVLDGLNYALGSDDALLWEIHPFKLVSTRGATHIWLHELGDVVNALGGLGCQSKQTALPLPLT